MNTSGFRVLLDQGLPRDTADELRAASVECRHVGEIGMSAASDTKILDYAAANGFVVATLDADFHTMLIVTGMSGPSVIRIRLEGLKGTSVAAIIREVLSMYAVDLAAGCMITVKSTRRRAICCSSQSEAWRSSVGGAQILSCRVSHSRVLSTRQLNS